MDSRERAAHFWTHVLQHVGVFLIGLAMIVAVVWLVTSEQRTKLYEADNVVCASQPGAMACWSRH